MPLHRSFAQQRIDQGPHDVAPADADALDFVREAIMGDGWLHPQSSNYTFMVELALDGRRGFGVYKPGAGEAPLWDFPNGSLYRRECAAFELSSLLGWYFVPPTVVREGEAGIGSLQLYVPPEEGTNFFTLRESHRDDLLRMAVFDLVANNADRKGGHCFIACDGTLWGVDHGLTFHADNKLRTVIWDFAGDDVPANLLSDLRCGLEMLTEEGSDATARLAGLLDANELVVLQQRIQELLTEPVMPRPYSRRDLPWPWL